MAGVLGGGRRLMGLQGVCPNCGEAFPLEAALADADARRALGAALRLPPSLARLIVAYSGLHAPAGRRIGWGKLARLLDELAAAIQSGHVERHRERYPAPLALWEQGLEEVLQARAAGQLTLPLQGHGYLAEIVWRGAAKACGRAAQAQRPLHPSHRPAELAAGGTAAPEGSGSATGGGVPRSSAAVAQAALRRMRLGPVGREEG